MSLAGEGAVAIWHDVRQEAHTEYHEWHNREHMPERVAVPGFRRGRRYIAVDAKPQFFTLYETDGPQILAGADYMLRLNNPTPWTRRVSPNMSNSSRSLCRVALSLGPGQGGLIMTLRYDVAEGRDEEQRKLLVHRLLPELADRPGVVGAHLCLADRATSAVQTEEKKSRPEKALVPNWIVLVEGGGEVGQLEAACGDALPDAALTVAGALVPIERGLYRLQYSRCKTPGTAG